MTLFVLGGIGGILYLSMGFFSTGFFMEKYYDTNEATWWRITGLIMFWPIAWLVQNIIWAIKGFAEFAGWMVEHPIAWLIEAGRNIAKFG